MKNSHVIEEYIDVGVPASFAFEHWTRYSDWSQFFRKEDAKAGDGEVQVNAKIGPSHRQWTTEVVKEERDRRLDWKAKGGIKARGSVIFNRLDDRLTHLTVDIEYQPSGAFETVGNFFRMPRRRVRKDLKLFKNYIELHADEDEEQSEDEQDQSEDERGEARGEAEGGDEAEAEDESEVEDESEAGEDEGSDDESEADDEDQEGR